MNDGRSGLDGRAGTIQAIGSIVTASNLRQSAVMAKAPKANP